MNHKTHWTSQKIAQRLTLIEPLVYRQRQELPPFRYTTLATADEGAPIGSNINDEAWETLAPNSYWGSWMTNFVLRTAFEVPTDWPKDATVALYLPLGEAGDFSHPEALAYLDGQAHAACDRHHQEMVLPEIYRDGQRHQLALHGWTGLGGFTNDEPFSKLFMNPCALVQIDQPSRDFIATARVALGVADHLDDNEPAKGHLYNALDEAFKVLDTGEPLGEMFYRSVPAAHEALRTGISKAGPALDVAIVASGHAHIDVAWLWTLAQTRRKAGRTFHTVLRLMEAFPDFHFTQSQPQLYDYIQQDYPGVFEAIKTRVAEGRWEPIGGMWVEADCNLSGPESLARQFLLGRSFFREHFGTEAESPVLWLPDVFGYAWNLPQLIKEAGVEYFFTIKISWNQYNRLPYDSFWWQGLDGTKVLTHFSTTPGNFELPGTGTRPSNYNATATPEEALSTWCNLQQKELQHVMLMAFGYGDGGGGPTREMLENIREMKRFPASPQLRHGRAGDFFHELEASSGDRMPTWNGELYLEYHRGTYTSQSRNKRANRKSEFMLHDAEFLATLAMMVNTNYRYPAEELRKAWELVCLNQFHDIIPGSSIGPVYQESLEQYAEVEAMVRTVQAGALQVIADQYGGDLILVNPTSFARSDLAFWSGHLATGQYVQKADGTLVMNQATTTGTWLDAGILPPYSVTSLSLASSERPTLGTGLSASETHLENHVLRVEFNQAGDIIRIYDKTQQREVLPEGSLANQLQAFEDRPMFWDAWDVDIFFEDTMWLADPATSIEVIEAGPLRATLEIKRRIRHSDIVQRISLSHNSPQLDFDTTINWQERHVLLKAAFPVNVFSPVATYEIQWGNVERPTHRNTSWDWARFETCAQKWVDLSEGDYGVSLLNDCKYGYDIRDNLMRLSLLRSPTMPDPEADQGEHRFAYSLLPHHGKWAEETIKAAYALNDPLMVMGSSADKALGRKEHAFIAADRPNIVIETIKQAEDGINLIVRLYESQRQRGSVTLTTDFDVAEAWQTNLLEENQTAFDVKGKTIMLSFRPYQIITLRLIPT